MYHLHTLLIAYVVLFIIKVRFEGIKEEKRYVGVG